MSTIGLFREHGVERTEKRTGRVIRSEVTAAEVMSHERDRRSYVVTEMVGHETFREVTYNVQGGYWGTEGNMCGKREAQLARETARRWARGEE